jgi:hypothetical protein
MRSPILNTLLATLLSLTSAELAGQARRSASNTTGPSAARVFRLDGVATGMRINALYDSLGGEDRVPVSCFYSTENLLAKCPLEGRRLRERTGWADTATATVDRFTGLISSVSFRARIPRSVSGDSLYRSLTRRMQAAWGQPGTIYGMTWCTEWGSRRKGAWACWLEDGRLLDVLLFDEDLADSARAAAPALHRRRFGSLPPYGYFTWWPVYRPLYLGEARTGLPADALAAALGVSPREGRCAPRPDLLSGRESQTELRCVWSTSSLAIARHPPREIVINVDRETGRAHSLQLSFGREATREAAERMAEEIGAELSRTWGDPAGSASSMGWRSGPFRAELRPLCWDECAPGEPWQVRLYLSSLASAAEQDEAALAR